MLVNMRTAGTDSASCRGLSEPPRHLDGHPGREISATTTLQTHSGSAGGLRARGSWADGVLAEYVRDGARSFRG